MDQRKRSRIVSRSLTIAALLGVVGLLVFGFMPKPIPVTLGKVERQTLEVTVDEPGKTRVRAKYTVSAPVTGYLSRIALRTGDRVEKDAILAELTPAASQLLDDRTRAETRARVAVAEANLERARAASRRAAASVEFATDQEKRSAALHAQGGVSQQALDQAAYEVRAAREELSTLRVGEEVAASELNAAKVAHHSSKERNGSGGDARTKVTVTAPMSGQVLRVIHESEGVVPVGAPLIELGDTRALEVVVDVLTTEGVGITVGSPARIERWGGSGALNARVRSKEPSAFTTRSALGVEEQRVPVVLDLVDPEERWRALGDGYRVETRIRTALIEHAVVVPASAVFRENGRFTVFAARDGKATKQVLDTGARTPDWVEVKKGLSPGDLVILYPSDKVVEGVSVTSQDAAH